MVLTPSRESVRYSEEFCRASCYRPFVRHRLAHPHRQRLARLQQLHRRSLRWHRHICRMLRFLIVRTVNRRSTMYRAALNGALPASTIRSEPASLSLISGTWTTRMTSLALTRCNGARVAAVTVEMLT